MDKSHKNIYLKPDVSFHVSAHPDFLFAGSSKKILSDPYIEESANFSATSYVVLPHTRKNKCDYIYDVDYITKKIDKYRNELIPSLIEVHNTDLDERLWNKALGMGFVRFAHMLYDNYKIFQQYDHSKHRVSVLNENFYTRFKDFEDNREVFQQTCFGIEQIFSLFVKTFFPDTYNNNKIDARPEKRTSKKNQTKSIVAKKQLTQLPIKVFKKIFRVILKKRKIKVGILNSFFSQKRTDELLFKSHGKIQVVNCNYLKVFECTINSMMREKLISKVIIEDDFDKFFIEACKVFFPCLYLENFEETYQYLSVEAEKLTGMKYVISEAWLSDSRLSLFIAILQARGIRHIFNEHNFLQHFLKGNHINHTHEMCDIYYTLGWDSQNYANIVKGASLFDFQGEGFEAVDGVDILHVASFPGVRMAEISSGYGEQEENALKYLKYIENFYSKLNQEIVSKITFRSYPNTCGWAEYKLGEFSNNLQLDNFEYPSKVMMKSANLVVVDYLSTSYLEILFMNKPLIILFDKDRYYLEEKYENFFDELIAVGVVQTCPSMASQFLNSLNVNTWWHSKKVQDAVRSFKEANLGNPQDAISYYLKLAKE